LPEPVGELRVPKSRGRSFHGGLLGRNKRGSRSRPAAGAAAGSICSRPHLPARETFNEHPARIRGRPCPLS
jgi:hypothetical protein